MKPNKETRRLIEAALSARKHAYCPYSRYAVGASVLTASGRVFAGCNVENASYGLSICAERAAIFEAVARGQKDLRAVCIVGLSAKPCGACRQVMLEFSTKDTLLYLVNVSTNSRRYTVAKTKVFSMLPAPFDPLASGLLSAPAHAQNLMRRRSVRRSSRRSGRRASAKRAVKNRRRTRTRGRNRNRKG